MHPSPRSSACALLVGCIASLDCCKGCLEPESAAQAWFNHYSPLDHHDWIDGGFRKSFCHWSCDVLKWFLTPTDSNCLGFVFTCIISYYHDQLVLKSEISNVTEPFLDYLVSFHITIGNQNCNQQIQLHDCNLQLTELKMRIMMNPCLLGQVVPPLDPSPLVDPQEHCCQSYRMNTSCADQFSSTWDLPVLQNEQWPSLLCHSS